MWIKKSFSADGNLSMTYVRGVMILEDEKKIPPDAGFFYLWILCYSATTLKGTSFFTSL